MCKKLGEGGEWMEKEIRFFTPRKGWKEEERGGVRRKNKNERGGRIVR